MNNLLKCYIHFVLQVEPIRLSKVRTCRLFALVYLPKSDMSSVGRNKHFLVNFFQTKNRNIHIIRASDSATDSNNIFPLVSLKWNIIFFTDFSFNANTYLFDKYRQSSSSTWSPSCLFTFCLHFRLVVYALTSMTHLGICCQVDPTV